MDSAIAQKRRWRPPRLLLRGESVIASTGLVLAVTLLLVMAATAYWTLRVQRETFEAARTAQLRSLGDLLSETASLMLSLDELSTVRRLLTNVGRTCELAECRIILPDGNVLADSDPSQITLAGLPAKWKGKPAPTPEQKTVEGVIQLSRPISISGLGEARLDIAASVSHPYERYWEALVGVGAIGAGALMVLLLIYRHARSKILALGVIRDALLALAAGEKTPEALALREDMGPEARAWNRLIADKERLRKQLVSARAGEVLTARPSADRQLQEMCDAMRQGIVMVDKDARATYANGAAAVYLSTAADKIVRSNFADISPNDEVTEAVKSAVDGPGRSWTVEIDQRGEDGGGVLRFTIRPLRREDHSAAMISIHDVTQQRVADEARNAFITQVTHELRSPLTNIRLYAESAIEDGEDDPYSTRKALNVINQEARRLEGVVADMLSVSEIEAGTMQLRKDDVRLDAFFEELEADYGSQARDKEITLEFVLPPKLPVIHADRDKIGLALHNLIGNAIKYTPRGGRVVVTVDVKDGRLLVDIADTGIGIASDELSRIFEKFYRAKDPKVADVTGSGLGLALAREVVRLHGGDIEVNSQPDKGSTFSVILPVSAKAA